MNGLCIILSCVTVWGPLFVLMVLFNLVSSWSWNWTLPLSRDVICLLQYLYLYIFIIKPWKWIKETCPKRHWNKIWICQIACDLFIFYKMWWFDSFSEIVIYTGICIESDSSIFAAVCCICLQVVFNLTRSNTENYFGRQQINESVTQSMMKIVTQLGF